MSVEMDIYIMTSVSNNIYTYQVHIAPISWYNFNLQVSQFNKSWKKLKKKTFKMLLKLGFKEFIMVLFSFIRTI